MEENEDCSMHLGSLVVKYGLGASENTRLRKTKIVTPGSCTTVGCAPHCYHVDCDDRCVADCTHGAFQKDKSFMDLEKKVRKVISHFTRSKDKMLASNNPWFWDQVATNMLSVGLKNLRSIWARMLNFLLDMKPFSSAWRTKSMEPIALVSD